MATPIAEEREVSCLRLIRIESLASWRAQAGAWDDLWSRSAVAVPTARAEMIAQWLEEFAPERPFCAFVVANDEAFLAGLMLFSTRIKRLVEVGSLLSNEWCTCSDLLVDPQVDSEAVLDLLAMALAEAPWPLVWLEDVPYEAPRFQALRAAFDRAGLAHSSHASFPIGQVQLTGSWAEYEAGLSSNHRRQMHKMLRRSERDGGIELERWSGVEGEQIETLLRRGFEIEDRGWKAAQGTSVLRTPRVFDYFCRQAQQLAQWGQLELNFLLLAGQPIAFEFGYRSKQTYFSAKVGFDENFAAYSPGQLLRWELLRSFWDQGQTAAVDFWGPLTRATACWANHSYKIGRVVVAPRRLSGRILFGAYQIGRRGLQALRRQPTPGLEHQDDRIPAGKRQNHIPDLTPGNQDAVCDLNLPVGPL
jgi:CelD/BcsL family acetyltransferase involved in cellulose biosynthesis